MFGVIISKINKRNYGFYFLLICTIGIGSGILGSLADYRYFCLHILFNFSYLFIAL